jgi:mannan endo-1,4-beta-mannosidase
MTSLTIPPSLVAYGATSHAVEDAESFNSRGGINTFVWHWNAPTCLYNTASEPWYMGFYTTATCFNLAEALSEGKNGANYKLLIRDIDAIAAEIQRRKDASIPILFRPLYEPDGG